MAAFPFHSFWAYFSLPKSLRPCQVHEGELGYGVTGEGVYPGACLHIDGENAVRA